MCVRASSFMGTRGHSHRLLFAAGAGGGGAPPFPPKTPHLITVTIFIIVVIISNIIALIWLLQTSPVTNGSTRKGVLACLIEKLDQGIDPALNTTVLRVPQFFLPLVSSRLDTVNRKPKSPKPSNPCAHHPEPRNPKPNLTAQSSPPLYNCQLAG